MLSRLTGVSEKLINHSERDSVFLQKYEIYRLAQFLIYLPFTVKAPRLT